MELKASKLLDIRFSEVDSMNVVWHGSYPLYFEDARELFGQKYDLTYMGFFDHGYFAPLVELTFQYKKPIRYGMRPRIDIVYRSTPAAKIVFDYEIHDPEDETMLATGHSDQLSIGALQPRILRRVEKAMGSVRRNQVIKTFW